VHNIDITILGEQALAALMQRLSEARGKHPVFAEGKYHALGVIGEEYRELVYAGAYPRRSPRCSCDRTAAMAWGTQGGCS
jgi:hypothetical protein